MSSNDLLSSNDLGLVVQFKEDDRERDFHHFVVLLHAFGHFCELAALQCVGDDLQVFARRVRDHDIKLHV